MAGLDDGSSIAVLLGVDYEKAFNRMEHATCLRQLRELGASEGSILLVRAFLEDRKMTITVAGRKARTQIHIRQGSPQGRVLECLLYCVATQAITKGLRTEGRDVTDRQGTDPAVFMYVDDTTVLDIVNVELATLHLTTGAT